MRWIFDWTTSSHVLLVRRTRFLTRCIKAILSSCISWLTIYNLTNLVVSYIRLKDLIMKNRKVVAIAIFLSTNFLLNHLFAQEMSDEDIDRYLSRITYILNEPKGPVKSETSYKPYGPGETPRKFINRKWDIQGNLIEYISYNGLAGSSGNGEYSFSNRRKTYENEYDDDGNLIQTKELDWGEWGKDHIWGKENYTREFTYSDDGDLVKIKQVCENWGSSCGYYEIYFRYWGFGKLYETLEADCHEIREIEQLFYDQREKIAIVRRFESANDPLWARLVNIVSNQEDKDGNSYRVSVTLDSRNDIYYNYKTQRFYTAAAKSEGDDKFSAKKFGLLVSESEYEAYISKNDHMPAIHEFQLDWFLADSEDYPIAWLDEDRNFFRANNDIYFAVKGGMRNLDISISKGDTPSKTKKKAGFTVEEEIDEFGNVTMKKGYHGGVLKKIQKMEYTYH